MMRIRYNRPSLITFPRGLRLMPGVNHVDDAAYEAVKTHPGWLRNIQAGTIAVIGSLAVSAEEVAEGVVESTEEATAPVVDSKAAAREAVLADVTGMADVAKLRKLAKGKDKELAEIATLRLEEIEAADKAPATEADGD